MKSLAILLLTAVATCEPTVYLIRHGEKPADGGVGLNEIGKKRARCLRDVFGEDSDFAIDYILAQDYKPDGHRKRPYLTVKPLADDLGLTVDTHCDRDDPLCVRDAIENYDGEGNILVCWQHGQMNDIVDALGAQIDEYPKTSWDLIWEVPYPFDIVTDIKRQQCPGIDAPANVVKDWTAV